MSNDHKIFAGALMSACFIGGILLQIYEPPAATSPAPASTASPSCDVANGTCSDSSVDCHWEVHYCEEWYDEPTDCMKLGPANPDVPYGKVSWSNYYCGCDMKCHPKGECVNGNEFDMIQQKCSGAYGWPECPEGAFSCYWNKQNAKNVHCPVPKCCGGWCMWDPCT